MTHLDHLAVASEHAIDNFARYYGELGGVPIGGGVDPGFFFWQLQYPGGMTIELLQDDPDQPDQDFLRRFLDRNGAGPHHLTFKVPDVPMMLDKVKRAGYTAVGVDVDDDEWQQAFLHPKEAPGVVIQMAHSDHPEREPIDDLPVPRPRCSTAADLERVVLTVADLERETKLFTGLLSGELDGRGNDELGSYADVVWPNGTRLRLSDPTDAAARQWMGARAGRVHHAFFRVADPTVVTGATALGEGLFEVPPEQNLGLRLRYRVGAG